MSISHFRICRFKNTRLAEKIRFAETVLPSGGEEKRARFRCPMEELLHLLGPSGGNLCQQFRRGFEDIAMVMFGGLLGEERRQIGQGVWGGELDQEHQRDAAARTACGSMGRRRARVGDQILVDQFFGQGLADGWQSSETTIDRPERENGQILFIVARSKGMQIFIHCWSNDVGRRGRRRCRCRSSPRSFDIVDHGDVIGIERRTDGATKRRNFFSA